MKNFTELEFQVMKQIILNEMTGLNGAMPSSVDDLDECVCWTDCVEDGGSVRGKQLSGVMSSLVQKDLIFSDSGKDGTCGPTQKGLELFLEEFAAK